MKIKIKWTPQLTWPVTIDKIWGQYPEKANEIVEKSLFKVYKVAKDSVNILSDIFVEQLSEKQKYLDILDGTKKDSTITIKSGNKQINSFIGTLDDDRDKVVCKVGCTININGTNPLLQTYYICKTCSTIVHKEVKIWASCVKFWHYNHKTIIANNGQKDRITCDCGINVFPNLPISKTNPLLPNIRNDFRKIKGWLIVSYKAGRKGKKAMKRSEKMNKRI